MPAPKNSTCVNAANEKQPGFEQYKVARDYKFNTRSKKNRVVTNEFLLLPFFAFQDGFESVFCLLIQATAQPEIPQPLHSRIEILISSSSDTSGSLPSPSQMAKNPGSPQPPLRQKQRSDEAHNLADQDSGDKKATVSSSNNSGSSKAIRPAVRGRPLRNMHGVDKIRGRKSYEILHPGLLGEMLPDPGTLLASSPVSGPPKPKVS